MGSGRVSWAKPAVLDTEQPSSSREQRAVPFRTLARAGLIVVVLAALGAYFAYARLIHYERHGLEHLPEGTGIMLDDIGAGLYALIVMQLLLHFGLLK